MRRRDARVPWPLAVVLAVVVSPLAGVVLAALSLILMETLS